MQNKIPRHLMRLYLARGFSDGLLGHDFGRQNTEPDYLAQRLYRFGWHLGSRARQRRQARLRKNIER